MDRLHRIIRKRDLPTYTGLVILYLSLPILVMMIYSFNNSTNERVTFKWQGATVYWWRT